MQKNAESRKLDDSPNKHNLKTIYEILFELNVEIKNMRITVYPKELHEIIIISSIKILNTT